MAIANKSGRGWREDVQLKRKRKPRPSNAYEWFTRGTRFFDGDLVDEALHCFHQAKRLGHERAAHAIQICENHGGDFQPTIWPKRRPPVQPTLSQPL